MKQKFGRSPDESDAVSILCEVARRRGLAPAKKLAFVPEKENNFVKAQNSVYDDNIRSNEPQFVLYADAWDY
jgi:hypothetical protein